MERIFSFHKTVKKEVISPHFKRVKGRGLCSYYKRVKVYP